MSCGCCRNISAAEAGITSSTLHTASQSGHSTVAPLKTIFSPLALSDHPSTFQHNISVILTTERRLSVLRRVSVAVILFCNLYFCDILEQFTILICAPGYQHSVLNFCFNLIGWIWIWTLEKCQTLHLLCFHFSQWEAMPNDCNLVWKYSSILPYAFKKEADAWVLEFWSGNSGLRKRKPSSFICK